jgi:16S rRNA (uracil1498-N3)-methyltransferase
MTNRYFCEDRVVADLARIQGPEAHHLTKVMRQNVGDQVILFDGSGAEFRAIVSQIQRDNVTLRVQSRQVVDRELPYDLSIAVALPKGDRQVWMVQKLVELGVSRLVPLQTSRGVARPTPAAISRLRRQVIESSKQCERNRLMEISPPMNLPELSASVPATASRMLSDPRGNDRIGGLSADVCFAVGPEGGFDDRELAEARSLGWQVVSLGPRILRVETAAVALAAWRSVNAIST